MTTVDIDETTLERANALVDYLNSINSEEVTLDGIEPTNFGENAFSYGDEEYYVFTDDEADDAFREDTMSLIDDMGIESFSKEFQKEILSDYIDEDPFEDFYFDDYTEYALDISDEDDDVYGNRLVRECYEADCITDDDFGTSEDGEVDYTDCLKETTELVDLLRDYLMDSLDGKFAEQFNFDFGNESFEIFTNDHNAIDWEGVVEEVKSRDGRGSLASYDGKEIEYNGYYIYRIN